MIVPQQKDHLQFHGSGDFQSRQRLRRHRPTRIYSQWFTTLRWFRGVLTTARAILRHDTARRRIRGAICLYDREGFVKIPVITGLLVFARSTRKTPLERKTLNDREVRVCFVEVDDSIGRRNKKPARNMRKLRRREKISDYWVVHSPANLRHLCDSFFVPDD